ncbi:hypothetical protein [Citromicrobium sp. WPS32]|uniref:hypothetical protein n=1 Tax=Citromicrobium sp. WPS32 TaxID=1634517 RepID=UPI0006C8EE4D|nr:hypothetical protein [Citromicrobium sp. WPS32]KPM14910.1 hypothetical protein WG75_08370 [Citromicrobium sp. WPS32]MAY78760.1 hypothetical protein [Citromicrobium sp.]MAY79129.1 hypothetical protein [Citromicrobium sp.]|tara:strand:+ start:224 stop:868 length:645 start_codon:yes stop_codon:yes gene_type:complete
MNDRERACADVIAQTHEFYRKHHLALKGRGYEVMYGPPIYRPDFFFIGFQPGGDHSTDQHTSAAGLQRWPEFSYYATEAWHLAAAMQKMFDVETLRRSTGSNAIFFRAPSMQRYYDETPVDLMVEIDRFCRTNLLKIIDVLEPKVIVAIGFSALAQFCPSYPIVTSPKGRTLVQLGTIGDRRALATLHLSGARISDPDRAEIARYLMSTLDEVH